MAHVRRKAGRKYYYADFVDAQGQRHQPCTYKTRERDAQVEADRLEREALRDPADVARERATWNDALDLLERYLEESVDAGRMADATAKFHRAKAIQITRVFTPLRKLHAFDAAAVRDYLAARRGGERKVSDHTLVKELVTLRLGLQLARERGLWRGDLDALQPAELAARYVPRARVLTPEDVEALRRELPNARWRVVAFSLATGAELSTWTRAERRDVDLAAGLVRVRGSKGAARARAVPVVLDECRELLAEALAGADQAPPHLFRSWPNAQRDLRVACERAEIEHVSPNDLRRTYATRHVEAGVSLELLARAMGHTTTAMLMRVYAKPSAATIGDLMREQIARRKPPP